MVNVLFFSFSIFCFASDPIKTLKAIRTSDNIRIDGHLNEAIWNNSEKATHFIQKEPLVGQNSKFNSEVRFLYDDSAIYIGAKLYDPEPSKILKEYSIRDNLGNADNFTVFVDAYKSGLNGFLFTVTASGVQLDAVVSDHIEDYNWNAIWESAITINEDGWSVEIKIPYSALRFSNQQEQEWQVQFGREIRRFREYSNWSPIDPLIQGWVQQSGKVIGIENIKSPVRLSIFPYVSGYINSSYDPKKTTNQHNTNTAYSAGLDLKYGLNDAFTLDMTLIPDFGQVISDNQILNLSPFEVFFEENRQFFTEGVEMFNRGNLFYSRRIGGTPVNFNQVFNQLKEGETIISNPSVSQLFNATKISGRTNRGTGAGVFNAIVGEEFAVIEDAEGNRRTIQTNPFTNYNAVVIDQNLPYNSFFSVMNTNVLRNGGDYDANVTGSFFDIKTKDQNYHISGDGAISQRFFKDSLDLGYTYNVALGKISGNWTYELFHGVESKTYNPNDMGFLFNPNGQYVNIVARRNEYKPKNEKLQLWRYTLNTIYSRLFDPNLFTDFAVNLETFYLYKSRFAFGVNSRIEPVETRDYFEPRTKDFGSYLAWPQNYTLGGFISSDYRKPFALDARMRYRYFDYEDRKTITYVLGPRFRFNDKFSLIGSTSISNIISEPGYVNKFFATTPIEGLSNSDILFGNRDRLIVDNSVTAKMIFTNNIGINLRVRHYWDKVVYSEFGRLNENGYLQKLAYDGKNQDDSPIFDRNVNIFNIDMQFNWRFAPGSDIIFVWKNQIANSDKAFASDYLQNLGTLFENAQENSLSIRVLYYLDYLYFFSKKA